MSEPWPPPPPPGAGGGWTTLPPGTPTSNGVAIAAMIVGILALLAASTVILAFVSFVPGIVAVILGVLGLSRARQHPAALGKVAAVTGIVCGALAMLATVGVVVIVAVFFASSDFALVDEEVATPDQYELRDQRCAVEDGQAVASGVLVNRSGAEHGFAIDVRFLDGGRDLGIHSDELESDLGDGQSWEWSVIMTLDPTDEVDTDGLDCDVVQVELGDVVSD